VTRFGRRNPIARIRRLFEGTKTPPPGSPRSTRVVGHRGLARLQPENTIPSFSAALDLGAVAVETDVCLTRDGHYVLWHDNEPGERVSLARGIGAETYAYRAAWPNLFDPKRRPVYEMTLAEMREICGYAPSRDLVTTLLSPDDPVVPFALLDDLIRWSADEPRLAEVFLDIKLLAEHADRAPPLLDAIAGRRPDLAFRFLLPERELWEALRGKELPPGVTLAGDFELPGVLGDVEETGIRHVSMGYTPTRTWGDFQRELSEVVAARDEGMFETLTVWTVNDEDKLRALVDARLDAILTDEPALLQSLLGGS
jgi:glycerophosphoryl diester phosphodiesterase